MMLLSFSNGDPFSTGSVPYSYCPTSPSDKFDRIILQVQIDGIMTEAYLDTGGIYLICSPEIAKQANIPARSIFVKEPKPEIIRLRGMPIHGDLFRVTLRIEAVYGRGIDIEVTAFVPRIGVQVEWDDFPCFLGMYGCLEHIRFAIDPSNTCFYFGALSA